LENGESLHTAAARESLEEALARVKIGSLLAVTNVLHASQVHVTFRAHLIEGQYGVGEESLESGLYAEAQIPWDDIAFPSISFALRCYFEDRHAGVELLHFSDIEHPLRG
jgi:ADP-ribose pyrophosphatase YjhB (NUDIX family)